ncbi:SDR family oxidoreductase [Cryobacterium sp. 5I3]|uniref:dTDP-4-dehydrorhamnose reductase family protein n=1 Tax=Cryobacterium sp. 5I3 TaxID=3048592 RepID=UPI002B229FD7|nr:SDR family oxidoreductase [Cryobacterium sp. 5I3]MEB0201773.1 SDR family oxidoreductase [Cryobacterium sp. 5I3]
MASRVLVLGGTGMLGNAVIGAFSERGLAVTATTRDVSTLPADRRSIFVPFDVTVDRLDEVLSGYGRDDYVINCIGVIKHHIDDRNAAHRRNAILINSEFPYALDELARRQGFRVVQIATDCVYSGTMGFYDETSPHDPTDVYGKTKSLGEVPSSQMLNLRCSIIGPENKNGKSLLEWVLAHDGGSTFDGYTDHLWNGVTAQAFGRVAAGIVLTKNQLAGTFHLVPADVVDKRTLSELILDAYGKRDISVRATATGHAVDRTLATTFPETNARLWDDGGYGTIPTIKFMVGDLAGGQTIRPKEETQ